MIAQLLIHPNSTIRQSQALKILEENALKIEHPNVLWIEEEKLGIEQIKKVILHLQLKPYQGTSQAVVILHGDNLTIDAQNSLLKTLEEPPGESIIILGCSQEHQLLSTITSRCQIVNLTVNPNQQLQEDEKLSADIEKIKTQSLEQRFQYIEKLKDKEAFFQALLIYYQKQLIHHPHSQNYSFTEDLIQASRWLAQNVNSRAVLEYLMLKMPK